MLTLTPAEASLLKQIKSQINIVADVSRADILLFTQLSSQGKSHVLAHAHPHSVAPVYQNSYVGATISSKDMPTLNQSLTTKSTVTGQGNTFGKNFSVAVKTIPVFSPETDKRVIGAVSINSNLLEHERQRRRLKPFKKAVNQLQLMLAKGLVKEAENLTPFEEYSGLTVVDKHGVIVYASGVASNLYRRLGFLDTLINRHLRDLYTEDYQLFLNALNTLSCVEAETEDGGRQWVKKAIPLLDKPSIFARPIQLFVPNRVEEESVGVLMVIRDLTEERRQAQQIKVKNAMIQEIHHRVKNNLQTIAALLRIQNRRIDNKEANAALKDAILRVQSIAVIHEFLSDEDSWAINMKEVFQRIVSQTQQGIVLAEDDITFKVEGPPIWLPARQATACALVINEMLQNALEHGFEYERKGQVLIKLEDEGDHVIISISDDGTGLPDDFDPNALPSLGLQIANTLVKDDLQGTLEFSNNNGTTATITFSKSLFKGEEGWNENVSS